MTALERINLTLAHREPDRVPIYDGPWDTTIARWHGEGLPADQTPDEFFGYDMLRLIADWSLLLPVESVEETEDYLIVRNSDGGLEKNFKGRTTTPQWTDFAVKSPTDWYELKPLLTWSPQRVDWEAARRLARLRAERGLWFHVVIASGWDRLQSLVGTEQLLLAMAEQPEWVQDMCDTAADLACTILEEVAGAGIEFDCAFLLDDLGYRNGPLFSPAMFARFEFANHQRIYQVAHSLGLWTILHSCGNMQAHLPALIEAGLDCLQPLEVKAGMDLIELKQRYGEVLSFMGGIDVRKMAHPDPALIEEEIATKVTCAKQGGGYIYHSDHSVPDNVSFERYCRVMELVKKYGSYE